MRRAAKRDTVELQIVETLKRTGWSVVCLSQAGIPDLLIYRRGHWSFVECKSTRGTLTDHQAAFNAEWRGPTPLIFRSVEDVFALNQSLRPNT